MSTVDTIEIAMEPALAKALRDSVDAGDYCSIDDAMRDAVRLWQDRRAQQSLESVKARIKRSLTDTRPSLSSREVGERLEKMFQSADSRDGRA